MLQRARRFTFLVLGLFLVSFFPIQAAQAYTPSPITTSVTWTTDQTLDGDLDINDGGHLTIASGVTITFTCAADVMDSYYIFVNPGGQLTADGVTFQGDGTAGCWRGIFVQSRDNQTVIENSVIRDAWMGVTIWQSSPTISNNEIYNLTIPDEVTPDQSFFAAVGIKVEGPDFVMEPIIQNNYIHHITGGTGADGADGADAIEAGAAGEDGGTGGNGGSVAGIQIGDENANVLVQGNRIEYLTGGACGVGGDGGDGAVGEDYAGSSGSGQTGGNGGHGGQGGSPGMVYGIYSYDTANTQIIDNEIAYLSQPSACAGGDGGMGGKGGNGADGDDGSLYISGRLGGQGGQAGSGGDSSANEFGVTGIMVVFPENEKGSHDRISGNTLHDFTAANGKPGGTGGIGGLGGDGGDGDPDSTLGIGNGGDCFGGGHGGNGGDNLGGSYAMGIVVRNVELSIESNTIYNIKAGDGGDGGAAGDGGQGGTGGVGGYLVTGAEYGDGGDGGTGGTGGQAGRGGNGGSAGGIIAGGDETVTVFVEIFNNDVWGVHGGEGGDGGPSGTGGTGGNGGNTLDLNHGVAGNGGDGGRGGPGASGESAGQAVLVMLNLGDGNVVNNTLVDVTAYEVGGVMSLGGPGGMYGFGGIGGTDGVQGSVGPDGSDFGSDGDGNSAIGVSQIMGENLTKVYNNILFLSDSSPENTYAFSEISGTFSTLDYNNIYGWDNPGCATPNGSNTIYTDPLFINAVDHSLMSNSPSIDAGTNTGAPSDDILGDPRPADGDGDGTATVDMGAFEAEATLILNFLPLLLK